MLAQQINNLPSCWQQALASELNQPYLAQLNTFLQAELAAGKNIYPAPANWLRALQLTPLNQVKLVLLGQDPYHGAGQAEGLSFSVAKGVALPPSLRNIFKELTSDLNLPTNTLAPANGSLVSWAKQGVLLLNRVLTVEEAKPNSHQHQGWESFTAKILQVVNQQEQPLVFLLWGKSAQSLAKQLHPRHLVLTAPHPSPLAAYRGFFGCQHFSQANAWLVQQRQPPINWQLED